MKSISLLCLSVSLLSVAVSSSRVLLYPYGHCLNSHLLNAEKLATLLLESGHEVTLLISDMYNDFDHMRFNNASDPTHNASVTMLQFQAPQNYKPICEYDTVDFMMYSPLQERFDAFIHTAVKYCDSMLSNRAMMASLKQHDFDLLIIEALDPCSKILADYLDIPFIPLITTGLGHWDGNPRLPSYLPAAIAPFTNKMTFSQRIGNLIMKILYETIPIIMGFDAHFEELKTKYDLNTSLSISTTFNRAALKFINSDFSVEYPAPVEPDSILIGGFAVEEAKPLSAELEAWMQSAGPAGVIVMSTGTLVKRFDHKWTDLFASAFSRLPQKVIWRYYDSMNQTDMLAYGFGENVRLMKWLPQYDLLNHPQTRLFITHCGLNALFEAVYSGVPVVAAPMSGDQMNNAAKLTDHLGMGVRVDMFSLDSVTFYEAIQTVLHDPKYARHSREAARRIRDRPVSIAQTIDYWVKYVIRHKGAGHLNSPARNLSLVQYFSLDVIATIIVAIFSTLMILIGLLGFSLWSLKKHIEIKLKKD